MILSESPNTIRVHLPYDERRYGPWNIDYTDWLWSDVWPR